MKDSNWQRDDDLSCFINSGRVVDPCQVSGMLDTGGVALTRAGLAALSHEPNPSITARVVPSPRLAHHPARSVPCQHRRLKGEVRFDPTQPDGQVQKHRERWRDIFPDPIDPLRSSEVVFGLSTHPETNNVDADLQWINPDACSLPARAGSVDRNAHPDAPLLTGTTILARCREPIAW